MKDSHLSRREFMAAAATLSSAGLAVPDLEVGSEGELSGLAGAEPGPSRKGRAGSLDAKVFLDPGAEYRGVAFFFLNDEIEPEEAVRQTEAMHRAGWGRVLPRRYAGLLHPSYGKQWNKAVHEIIQAAKKLGAVWSSAWSPETKESARVGRPISAVRQAQQLLPPKVR